MCCIANLELTNKFLEKKRIKVYKGLVITKKREKKELISPYEGWPYAPGVIVADVCGQRITESCPISYGIHVYLSKKSCLDFAEKRDYTVVEFTANIEDLLGVGTFDNEGPSDNAVFKQVYLSEEEYKRVIKCR